MSTARLHPTRKHHHHHHHQRGGTKQTKAGKVAVVKKYKNYKSTEASQLGLLKGQFNVYSPEADFRVASSGFNPNLRVILQILHSDFTFFFVRMFFEAAPVCSLSKMHQQLELNHCDTEGNLKTDRISMEF